MYSTSYVAILGDSNIKTSVFTSKYLEKIAEAMEDPKTHFIFSEEGALFNCIYRYLKGRGYQNYTVYHIGSHPKLKTRYTKGGFSSYIEIGEALNQDADSIITI